MVKSADTADLKSADLNRSWGFKSPSGHQRINNLSLFLGGLNGRRKSSGAIVVLLSRHLLRIFSANPQVMDGHGGSHGWSQKGYRACRGPWGFREGSWLGYLVDPLHGQHRTI